MGGMMGYCGFVAGVGGSRWNRGVARRRCAEVRENGRVGVQRGTVRKPVVTMNLGCMDGDEEEKDTHRGAHTEEVGCLRCPECGLAFCLYPSELQGSEDPQVVECGVCMHQWFAQPKDLISLEEVVDENHPTRVAARRRKKRYAQLIPAEPATIRASNLSFRTTSSILKKVFAAYGRVLRSELIPSMGPHERPTGLIEMSSREEAGQAINGLNQTNVFGAEMRVEMADANAFREVPSPELSIFDDYGDIDDFVVDLDSGSDSDLSDIDRDRNGYSSSLRSSSSLGNGKSGFPSRSRRHSRFPGNDASKDKPRGNRRNSNTRWFDPDVDQQQGRGRPRQGPKGGRK